MEMTNEWDYGRTQMELIMKEKAKNWKSIDECIAAGTCPEKLVKPIKGPFECDETGIYDYFTLFRDISRNLKWGGGV